MRKHMVLTKLFLLILQHKSPPGKKYEKVKIVVVGWVGGMVISICGKKETDLGWLRYFIFCFIVLTCAFISCLLNVHMSENCIAIKHAFFYTWSGAGSKTIKFDILNTSI